ncbi:hypothetical protein TruAng_012246 [Truncatella angustata]|nr:hypothetical protein TruAng_012246 [Truncatella angustata]
MLHVLVAGAGIAGLTAGIALRRAGHTVHVYERSSMNEEVGAAINLPPNAGRHLISWGLDPIKCRFVKAESVVWLHPQTLKTVARHEHANNLENYGAELWYAHRVDLHDALRQIATDQDGIGPPVTIHLKSFVVGYVCIPTLANGKIVQGDLIIGADGLHSIACETVLGRRNPPVQPKHYNYCYRFLIPAKALEADPDTEWFNQDSRGLTRLFIDNEGSRRLVAYTCRDNTIHNLVGIFYDNAAKNATREDYLASVEKETLTERFKGFSPKIIAVINKATEIKRWPLLYRAPVPRWRKGHMALAGDSAHPMLPHQAQGGAQGIEDGVALGVIFEGANPDDVEERLDLYEKVRRGRASVIQILSNVGQDQSHLVREDLKDYLDESQIPTNPAENYSYMFGHNVEKEAAALKLMTLSQ